MAALLESGTAADMTFMVEDEEMKVHRIILQVCDRLLPSDGANLLYAVHHSNVHLTAKRLHVCCPCWYAHACVLQACCKISRHLCGN